MGTPLIHFQNIYKLTNRRCSTLKFSLRFRFELTLAYMSGLITFQAYGHVTMDCTIVAFYALAQVQIRMLRYNLERLVEFDGTKINRILNTGSNKYCYIDDKKEKTELQERLKKCVVHYQQILR